MEEIRDLVAFEQRGPGTDAERRAAGHLVDRLRSLGRSADVEPIEVRPAYALTHLIHALVAIAGSVLAVTQPVVGVIVVLAASAATLLDLTGRFQITRRLTPQRSSQNVVSTEDTGKAGTLVLLAHYDAARAGSPFGPTMQRLRIRLGRLIHRPIGPFRAFFAAIVLILACACVRLLDIDPEWLPWLTLLQFIPTVALIVSLPLLADVHLSNIVPGAGDNASGVATVLRLAERYGGALEHFDVWVVLPGAEEGQLLGMREWLRRYRKQLDPRRTIFLNVESVGSGTVRYHRREGYLLGAPFNAELRKLCAELVEADSEGERFGARERISRSATAAHVARTKGYPAASISCAEGPLDFTADRHQLTDTPDQIDPEALERAHGFCAELIELIDERLGPRVASVAGRSQPTRNASTES